VGNNTWLVRQKVLGKTVTAQLRDPNTINILLCSDKNVIRGMGVTIVSILENISSPCTVHIAFNGELPEYEEAKFCQLASHYKVPIIFYWIDDTKLSTLYSHSFINQTAYYRLVVPYILHEAGIEKCLYLDTDILCVRDFSRWYKRDIKGHIAYVTKDATSKPMLRENITCGKLGMKGKLYFNSGILLINIPEYVKSDIGNKAIALCQKQNFDAMDQDVLNILMEGKVVFDDTYAYNCGLSVRNHEVPEKIYFIHFTGSKKPWKLCTSKIRKQSYLRLFSQHSWKNRYYKVWRKYASLSPWKDEPFELPRNHREWRYVYTMYFQTGNIYKAMDALITFLQVRHREKKAEKK
jgi:lipopolysaccharide biosynthesis glycosyltransferase